MNSFRRLVMGFLVTGNALLVAAPQVVSGPTPVTLDVDGFLDGATFTGQLAVPSTLNVPLNQTVNFNNNATGISTDSFAKGTVIFQGNSNVFGTTGIAGGNPMFSIVALDDDVIFHNDVSSQNFTLGSHLISITGDLTLPANGTTIQSTILSDSVFGNITVNDSHTNTINAPSVNVVLDSSLALNLADGQQFDIISAPTGSSNVPITISNNNVRYLFSPTNPLGSVNGNVSIVATKVPIPTLVNNPNAKAVGLVLDEVLPVAGAFPLSDLALVETNLGFSTNSALENAVLQLSAAPALMGVARETFNASKQFQKLWLEHLQQGRRLGCEDPCNNGCTDYGLKVWADGFVYFGHQGDRKYYNGYDAHTWGTMLAIDMPFSCDLRGGFGFGYAYTDVKENIFGNNTNIHNYQGTFYLNYQPDCWFLDGGLSLGWNRYDGTRRIDYNAIDRTAHSRYNGQEVTVFAAAGFQQQFRGWEITPLASLIYTYLHQAKYKEKGADALNLFVREQNYRFLQSSLGVKAAYLMETCYGSLIPELHTFWLHDLNRAPLSAQASFIGLGAAGGTFNNKGTGFDQNTWNIGTSVTFWARPNFSIMGEYDFETSSHYYDHQGLIELAYYF